MNKMELRLKPCPFCGGEAECKVEGVIPMWYFECKKCCALVSFNSEDVEEHPGNAVYAWNMRADSNATD